jgi:hypothetical protein
MRKFVKNGPELSYEVLHAHEEKRLVFFCGAGISYYTGLPGFRELVEEACSECGHPVTSTRNIALKEAFEGQQYDLALHILEQQVERSVARKKLRSLLSKPIKKGSKHLRLHKAILDLATVPGGVRIVTTNFDNRFAKAKKSIPFAEAPRLGPPRLSSWNHLTYLHGRIAGSDDTCEDLILTSGDFGRAYLTDGWASRFLVELFRDYTVLFIGYSLKDPVLRYIVDALATDTKEGRFRQPYVFADCMVGKEAEIGRQWSQKGVTPLLFSTGPSGHDYSPQEETLVRWAENYQGGLGSRISGVLEATRRPYIKSPDDDELKNVVWALSKKDGAVAHAFADADPQPHISWLEPLSIANHHIAHNAEEASLIALPSPTIDKDGKAKAHLAPLAGDGAACIPGLEINPVTFHLGRWLAKNLAEKSLVDWVVERKGIIHPNWRNALYDGIKDLAEPWRSFWILVTSGATTPPCSNFFLQEGEASRGVRKGKWADNATEVLMSSADSWIEPGRSFSFGGENDNPTQLAQICQFTLRLRNPHFLNSVLKHKDKAEIRTALAALVDPLTSKLADALRLAEHARISQATIYSSVSVPTLPDQKEHLSITSWLNLVYLLVASFMAARDIDEETAVLAMKRWRALATTQSLRFFRRLSVFAMRHLHDTSPEVVNFLLKNEGEILWDQSSWPEVGCLLPLLSKANKAQRNRLISSVNHGPSRSQFPNFSGSEEDFSRYSESMRIRRIAAMSEGLFVLPKRMTQLLDQMIIAPPESAEVKTSPVTRWIAPKASEEILGLEPFAIATHLSQKSAWDAGHELADVLRQNLVLGLDALSALIPLKVDSDLFDIAFEALRAVKGKREAGKILNALLNICRNHRDWLVTSGVRPISRVLSSLADEIPTSKEKYFLELWDLGAMAAAHNPQSALLNPSEPVEEAINAPMGDLSSALLARLFKHDHKADSGLPLNFAKRLSLIWGGMEPASRHARVIIASRLLWLYRIDSAWVVEHIVPALERADDQAYEIWSGILWQAHWDIELVSALQNSIEGILPVLGTRPEEFVTRFTEWLASILVNTPKALPSETWYSFFSLSTTVGLSRIAWVFTRYLEESNARAGALWHKRIKKLFVQYWPIDVEKRSSLVAADLLQMAIASRDGFPDAIHALIEKAAIVNILQTRLDFLLDLSSVPEDAEQYDIVKKHPESVLIALDQAIGDSVSIWHWDNLKDVLDNVERADPRLKQDSRMRRLREVEPQR